MTKKTAGTVATVITLYIILLVAISYIPGTKTLPDVIESVRGSVVHIKKPGVSQGSGCLISPDGILFTARHVTDGKMADFKVTLDDGRVRDVSYVIEDEENDLSFMQLKLEPGETVPYAKLHDGPLRVGEDVLIIGSSLGFANFNTVSNGIISALNRGLNGYTADKYKWSCMIQSTSPAYPGNSGGPVFSTSGEVIGVLVAGVSPTLNYSVPVHRFYEEIGTVRMLLKLSRFNELEYEEEGY